MKQKLSDYGINGDDNSKEYSNPQTAVEWLVEQLNEKAIINGTVDLFVMNILIKQSIPMEKEQAHKYAEFAIRCDRKDMKILNFEDWIKL